MQTRSIVKADLGFLRVKSENHEEMSANHTLDLQAQRPSSQIYEKNVEVPDLFQKDHCSRGSLFRKKTIPKSLCKCARQRRLGISFDQTLFPGVPQTSR